MTYVKLNYSWTLGAPGASCTASCAAARLQCFPAAKPGWAGWPRTAAAFEGVLASVPGGAGLCKADVEPSTRGGVEPVTFTSDGNCYFDPKGQDSCAGAPPPALSGALARRLWCARPPRPRPTRPLPAAPRAARRARVRRIRDRCRRMPERARVGAQI